MVLNLESPVGSNFLKDFTSLHAVNSDDIDNFAGPCLVTHPIQTYVPSLTSSGTQPVLGTGNVIVGKYYKIFDQIFTWGEFRFGTTGASAGTGEFRISLPFKAKTNISSGNPYTVPIAVGSAHAFNTLTDASRQPLVPQIATPDYLIFSVKMSTGGASRRAGNLIPFTWSGATPGDGIMWGIRYQRDTT
jgi:hypothetical protein